MFYRRGETYVGKFPNDPIAEQITDFAIYRDLVEKMKEQAIRNDASAAPATGQPKAYESFRESPNFENRTVVDRSVMPFDARHALMQRGLHPDSYAYNLTLEDIMAQNMPPQQTPLARAAGSNDVQMGPPTQESFMKRLMDPNRPASFEERFPGDLVFDNDPEMGGLTPEQLVASYIERGE